jgi:hypothetical protein
VIDGFADQPSVCPGDQLVLRVSTDAPAFRVEFYRCGADLAPLGHTDWLDGAWAPPHLPYHDWGRPNEGLRGEELPAWTGYPLPVPAGWPPGVYLAVFIEGDGRGRRRATGAEAYGDGRGRRRATGAEAYPASGPSAGPAGAADPPPRIGGPDARSGRCLFVVRAATPSVRILYKLPLLTYHAYNEVLARATDPDGVRRGWCLYTLPSPDELPRQVPPSVSVRRPGGGTGGTPWDVFNFDPFDRSSPRQTFAHWDAPFLAWLERAGYQLDYCTDLDLHEHGLTAAGDGRAGHRLLLSAGHDEYWSEAMRDHAERFVRDGGNIAFFGGNTCWWRVSFDPSDSAPGSGDGVHRFRRLDNWPDRPENMLTGVSFRNGGERDRDDHPLPVGYQVQHADHWVYAGTGLREGDCFGDRPDEYLVGYECDGAHFDRGDLARGRPARPTGEDGTPDGFTILGVGDTSPSGWGFGNRAATLGLYTADGSGTVFTAATTDWPRVLAAGSPAVDRLTRNVLDHLG